MLSAMSPPRRSSAAADDNVYRVANQKLVCTIMIREECSLWKLQVREAKTAHWIKLYLISMANKSAWILLCINYIYNPSTPYPSPFENQRFVCCMKVNQWSFLLIPHFLAIHICNGSHCGGGGGGRWREWRDSVNYPGEAASRVQTF